MAEQMGKYQLLRKLATGGMAEVFLARAEGPLGFEKTLVVKRILPHLAEEPQFTAMFLAEAKLAARLSHANVVQIFDFGVEEGSYFIAMEYIDGPNLRVLSRQSFKAGTPIPYPLCARIISLVCEGLAYAHELTDPGTGQALNLVHRDISPDNILLSRTGGVKVADFGIAKAANQDHRTRIGVLKGKIAYMSPERLKREPLDLRADVFALGVVLYRMITGQKPFKAEGEVSLMEAILTQPLVAARARRPDVPEALERVLERALAKDRNERYQSCRDMQSDLERYLLECGIPVGAYQIAELIKRLTPVEELGAQSPAGTGPGQESEEVSPFRASSRTPSQEAAEIRPAEAVEVPGAPIVTTTDPVPPVATGDLQLPRRERGPMVGAALLLLLVAGAIGTLVLTRSRPPPEKAAQASSGAPELALPGSPHPEVEPPPPPPARPVAEVPPPVVDERPPSSSEPEGVTPLEYREKPRHRTEREATKPRRESSQHKVEVASAEQPVTRARLRIRGHPEEVVVTLDGKSVGQAPLAVEVTEGSHRITVIDSETSRERTYTVQVKAGEDKLFKYEIP